MTMATILRTIAFSLLAVLCEIAGGYMLWVAIKHRQPIWLGIFGAIILSMFGVIASLQRGDFGRNYAAYGGLLVIMALIWGWVFDKTKPDFYSLMGAAIILIGASMLFYSTHKIH
jgi:small multidrug resistance family-3 protein